MVNVRVQGAIRSYAAGFLPDGRLAILKNDNGYSVLAQTPFAWEKGREYTIAVTVKGNEIRAVVEDVVLSAVDEVRPYLHGSIGVSLQNGSHDRYKRIRVLKE